MTESNLTADSGTKAPVKRAETAYTSPELFEIGAATYLLQGPMVSAPYRDLHNDWYTNWPQP